MKVIYIKQTDLKDCGVSCLMSIVRYYGGYVRREYVREITNTTKDGVTAYSMIKAAPLLGLEASALKGDIKNLKEPLPLIAHLLINNSFGHFVVITKLTSNYVTVMDPNAGYVKYSYDEWQKISTNTYLIFRPKNNLIKQLKEKGFMKLLLNILKKYQISLALIFIFSLIYTIINILMSYGIEIFIKFSSNKLIHLFILFLILLFLKELSNLFRNYLINYLNHSLDKTLVSDVYNHIIKLPYSYFKCRRKGDIITRIEDVSKIREVISKCLVTIFIDCLFVIITLCTMFHIHSKLTLYVLVITGLYILIILLYSKEIAKKIKTLKEDEVLVSNHLIESLSSIDTIKGMQLEKNLKDKLILKHNKLLSNSFKLNKIYFQETFFKDFLYGIGTLVILLFGSLEIYYHNLSLSTLMVYLMLVIYYFNPITNICNMELLIQDAKISFVRIKELLNIEEEKGFYSRSIIVNHLKGNININRLIYSYNGMDNNLECDKLSIKAGEKVLLYGESGGGKSTLMKLLVRYFTNYKGEIKIDNIDINNYDLSFLRNKITYVSQEELLYTDSIYNNIVPNKDISYNEYKNILDLTGVSNIIKRSILSDEMLLENNASNLSGGEKQRVVLARSLVKKSDIYIFDESFSALDIQSERVIIKKVFNYLKGKTVIVISHRFNNRDLYQKFILLKKGKIYEY